MAAASGCRLIIFLMSSLVFECTISQTTTTSQNEVRDSKNDLRNNGSNGGSADNGSKSANSSNNLWIASTSNCSCVRELSALKRDLHDEINQRLALKSVVDNFMTELSDLKNTVTINNNKSIISLNAPASMNPSVAFSAKLSYNRELKPLDTVVFDTVLTNDGNTYDLETGKFTAIVSGTYFFHSTILSGYNTKVETAIIVNDKEIARIYSGAHDAHGSGSNMAIVNLRTGDSVWVRLLYQGGNHVHGYYSTFSGALLKSTYDTI